MVREEHDIEALVRASAAGDTQSFNALYESLVDRIFAYLRSRTRTTDDAMDLTQEAMVALYRALPTFTYRTREEFYAFVFVIVRRSLAKHYEATSRAQDRVDVDMNELAENPHDTALAHDVHRSLGSLDELAREIVVLHHWSRYTFGEIAAMLAMQESAVRVRHHRALKALKTHFDTL